MTAEPLGHVIRLAPPWRAESMTECGRPLNDVASTMTRDEARAFVNQHGQQRAALLICMTCAGTVGRYATWAKSPSDVLLRDGSSRWRNEPSPLDAELHAIAALIEAHRDEFDGYLTGLADTVSLSSRRAAKTIATRTSGRRL